MALTETQRLIERLSETRWRVIQTFRCPNAEADGHEAFLWYTAPQGYSSYMSCRRVRRFPNQGRQKDWTQLVAIYETLSLQIAAGRVINVFQLSIKGSTTGKKTRKDIWGNCIEGIDPEDAKGLTIWTIEEGENIVGEGRVVYIAYGLVDSLNTYVNAFTDKIGLVNDAGMSKFGNHTGKGQLLFDSIAAKPRGQGQYWVWYCFIGSNKEGGWNDECKARKHTLRIQEVPVLDADGADANKNREVKLLQPDDILNAVDLFPDANFSLINSKIEL